MEINITDRVDSAKVAALAIRAETLSTTMDQLNAIQERLDDAVCKALKKLGESERIAVLKGTAPSSELARCAMAAMSYISEIQDNIIAAGNSTVDDLSAQLEPGVRHVPKNLREGYKVVYNIHNDMPVTVSYRISEEDDES